MNKYAQQILNVVLQKNNTGTVARNTIYLTASEVFLKFIGILWVVYLARTFSVADYGQYNLVTSFIAIFSFLPDFGIGIIVIREIAKNNKQAAVYLGNSLFINGLLSVFTFFLIVTLVFGFDINSSVGPLVIISGITLAVSTIRSVAIFYFDGREKMQYSAMLNSLNTLLIILFATLGVMFGFGLLGVFTGMLIGTVLSLLISWTVLLRFIKPEFKVSPSIILLYIKSGAPLGIAAFASLIFTRIDVLILGTMLGDQAAGIYSSATPFGFALIQLLNVPFMVAVFPALTRINAEDNKRFKRGLLKSVFIISAWSIPAVMLVASFSGILIPYIFGNKYDAAIPILKILIFFVPFICISALLYKVLIIIGKQKDYLFISICGAFINILLNVFLIGKFGISGAAYAAILTQAILLAIYSVVVFYHLQKK